MATTIVTPSRLVLKIAKAACVATVLSCALIAISAHAEPKTGIYSISIEEFIKSKNHGQAMSREAFIKKYYESADALDDQNSTKKVSDSFIFIDKDMLRKPRIPKAKRSGQDVIIYY